MQLARSRNGRLYRKQILKFGNYAHPNGGKAPLVIDDTLADSLIRNFRDKVCDIVQVPIVDGQNQHVEDPLRNVGEVIDLEKQGDGIFAVIDARKPELADQLGKTLIGASAMMHMDYKDTRSGKKVGPTLLHVAITNRPYITDLQDFEEVIAASADSIGDNRPVVLTEMEESSMDELTKETAIAYLRDEHGIEVGEQAAPTIDAELVQALSRVLREAGAVSLSREEGTEEDEAVTVTDVAEAVIELSQEKLSLESRVAELEGEVKVRRVASAEAEVDSLVEAGRILPTQRDTMLKLSLSDRETFEALVPGEPLVKLSEEGVTVHEEPESEKFDTEVARLVELANDAAKEEK